MLLCRVGIPPPTAASSREWKYSGY